jgi:hypothetical protein
MVLMPCVACAAMARRVKDAGPRPGDEGDAAEADYALHSEHEGRRREIPHCREPEFYHDHESPRKAPR